MQLEILIGLVVLSAIFLFEGLRLYKKASTVDEFFLYGGKLKLTPFVGSLVAANISLGNFIFLCAIWGYSYGLSGMLWISVCLALLPVAFFIFGPYFKTYIEDRANTGTIHEYLSNSFSRFKGDPVAKNVRLTASLATIICLLLAIVVEIHLAATILAPTLNINLGLAFVVLIVLIGFCTALSGYRSVILTDVIQAILLLISLAILVLIVVRLNLPWLPYSKAYNSGIQNCFWDTGWHNIISIVVIGFGWLLVTMDSWQRTSASRSINLSKKGAVIGTAILIGFVIFYSGLGLYDRLAILPSLSQEQVGQHSQGLNPITDFFLLAGKTDLTTRILFGFTTLAFIMAALSTANTFLNVCAHSLVSDVMIGVKKRASFGDLTETEKEAFANIGRAVTIGMCLFVMGIWMLFARLGLLNDPITLFFVAYSVQFSLLVPVMYSVKKTKDHPGSALVSIWAGIIASLVCGLKSAIVLQTVAPGAQMPSFLRLTVDQWLALTPLVTIGAGLIASWLSKAAFRWVPRWQTKQL